MIDISQFLNKPFRASRKSEGKDGQTYWNAAGLTVWLSDYQGELRISLVDERTGERYPCFPPKPRNEQQFNQEAAPSNDDVPF